MTMKFFNFMVPADLLRDCEILELGIDIGHLRKTIYIKLNDNVEIFDLKNEKKRLEVVR